MGSKFPRLQATTPKPEFDSSKPTAWMSEVARDGWGIRISLPYFTKQSGFQPTAEPTGFQPVVVQSHPVCSPQVHTPEVSSAMPAARNGPKLGQETVLTQVRLVTARSNRERISDPRNGQDGCPRENSCAVRSATSH